MKIAICDDLPEDRTVLLNDVKKYAQKKMLNFEIDEFSSGSNLLSVFQDKAYKILFLDIYMDSLSGVDVAYKIREFNRNSKIIFTTTSPDFRAEGFDVGATHYLLKPIAYEDVEESLNRCSKEFVESEKFLNVLVDRRNTNILFQDILFVEVYGKTCLIHTENETFSTYITLSKIEEQLSSGPFLRCHRCYIANMKYIDRVLDKDFQLTDGTVIPIRKNGQQDVKDAYARYLFQLARENGYA